MSVRIVGFLGRGSFGVVFECENKEGERFAMKRVVRHSLILPQEAVIAQRMGHACLLPLHYTKFTSCGAKLYANYAMPRFTCDAARFVSVAGKLSRTPSTDLLARLSIDCVAGLSALHRGGFVHRDVKAANLLLQISEISNGQARAVGVLADLGSARPLGATDSYVYASPVSHRSPMQWFGAAFDASSDSFSFGILLLELLGAKPTVRDARDCLALMPPLLASLRQTVFGKIPRDIRKLAERLVDASDGRLRKNLLEAKALCPPSQVCMWNLGLRCLSWEPPSTDDIYLALSEAYPSVLLPAAWITLYDPQ